MHWKNYSPDSGRNAAPVIIASSMILVSTSQTLLTRVLGEHSVQFPLAALDSVVRKIVQLVAPDGSFHELRLGSGNFLPFDIEDSEMGLGFENRRAKLIARLVLRILQDLLNTGVDLVESVVISTY